MSVAQATRRRAFARQRHPIRGFRSGDLFQALVGENSQAMARCAKTGGISKRHNAGRLVGNKSTATIGGRKITVIHEIDFADEEGVVLGGRGLRARDFFLPVFW